jgi:uncharacterized protein YcbK (DUF882 family)
VIEKRRSRIGLTRRQERLFIWAAVGLVAFIATGWTAAIVDLHAQKRETPAPGGPAATVTRVTRTVATSLLDPEANSTAYLDDAALDFLNPLRGESGKLQMAFRKPEAELPAKGSHPGAGVTPIYEGEEGHEVGRGVTAPSEPGLYTIAVGLGKARRAVQDLRLVTLVPFAEKKGPKIGLYYIGSWPYEQGGQPRSAAYANPAGFIEVTKENKATPVSEHFKLQDFLTKDQYDVWPKYLVLDSRLIDKLELLIAELEAEGHPVKHLQIMSGFRTPYYNHAGGNTGGRANLSRHMYGDAADVFVDNDRNGIMDDLNGDGRVDVADAEVIARAADRVEAKHPAMVGGVGIYKACCGHGPFTHVDVRGYRARWRGEGAG